MFKGVSAFPLTPLSDDAVDEGAFGDLVHRAASAGVDSITALGSTGSYAYLTLDERRAAARVAVECALDIPVIIGVGATRTSHVIELARDAESIGAAGLMVAPVSYQALTDNEVFELYSDVVAVTELPVVVYDNPGTTHFAFSDDLYARIANLPNIASIKIPGVPTGAASARARIDHLRSILPEHVTIGISGDASAATGLNAGCDAWYSVIAGTLPQPALTITRAAQAGDAAGAIAASDRLQPLWDLFAEYGGSFRVVAALAEHLGLAPLHSIPRPVLGLADDARRRLARIVSELGLAT